MRAPSRQERVFLLSPANASGKRARMLLRGDARFDLAVNLHRRGAPLDEVFRFLSGLYFRGKLAYAEAFAAPPPGAPGILVIAPGRGLILPETPVTVEDLREMAAVPVHEGEPRYRLPLERDAAALADAAGPDCAMVLLGSVATRKYLEPLLRVLGERLLFPAEFAGRGDMSRGGLMLRCVRSGTELNYIPVAGSSRHGPRPPKLPPYLRA